MNDTSAPFLKWAGGKRLILSQLLPLLPVQERHECYFEPFLGGGAVFFSTRPRMASLSDTNQELIDTYIAVRDQVDELIESLGSFRNEKSEFYRIRKWAPMDSVLRAARFIYLNKTCWNGLYRVNLSGEFNVPFGRHGNVRVCDEEQIRSASDALQSVTLAACDFEEAVTDAQPGDVVYFDPPYIVSHTHNGFVEYNARVFSWADQRRLASIAASLVKRGVKCAVSNADHRSIIGLYMRYGVFSLHRLVRWSTIAASASKRFPTTEILFVGQHMRGKRSARRG